MTVTLVFKLVSVVTPVVIFEDVSPVTVIADEEPEDELDEV